MKRIGFLSSGHWPDSPYSQLRSASDALLESIQLAVAFGELGADGEFYLKGEGFAQSNRASADGGR